MTGSEAITVIHGRERRYAECCLEVINAGLNCIPNSGARALGKKRKPKLKSRFVCLCVCVCGVPRTRASRPPSLAHTRSPSGLCGGARNKRRCPGGRAHRPRRGSPVARRGASARGRAVSGLLRARPVRGGGLGRASANPCAAPRRLSPGPASASPSPASLGRPGPPTGWRAAAQALPQASPQRGHPGARAAGLRPAAGGHAGMAGRRGQGGSLPPQDLLLCPGHPGPAEIHPRCAPGRAPCSPGSQEKFGRGRGGEGRQSGGSGPAARDSW